MNYNLTNPRPVLLADFVAELAATGIDIKSVSQDEWFEAAKQVDPADLPGAATTLLGMSSDIGSVGAIAFGRNLQQFDCTNSLSGLAETDIRCPELNAEFLRIFRSSLETPAVRR